MAYLNPVSGSQNDGFDKSDKPSGVNVGRVRRVIDRDDLRQYKIPFSEIAD